MKRTLTAYPHMSFAFCDFVATPLALRMPIGYVLLDSRFRELAYVLYLRYFRVYSVFAHMVII